MLRVYSLIFFILLLTSPTVARSDHVNIGGPSAELVWHPARGFYGGNNRPATKYVYVNGAWSQIAKTYKLEGNSWVETKSSRVKKDSWTDRYVLEGIYQILLGDIYPARPQYKGNDFVLSTTGITSPVEDFYCLDSVVSGKGVVVDTQTMAPSVTLDCLDTTGGWVGDMAFRLDVVGKAGVAAFLIDGSFGTALTGNEYYSYTVSAETVGADAYIYSFEFTAKSP